MSQSVKENGTPVRKKVLPCVMGASQPVWPSCKALGRQAEGLWFDSLWLSSLQNIIVVYGHCLTVTLFYTAARLSTKTTDSGGVV